jgi:hypothetical protein
MEWPAGFKALWTVEENLLQGRLGECLKSYACDEIELYATYAGRTYLPPRIRVFVDFVAAALQGPGAARPQFGLQPFR